MILNVKKAEAEGGEELEVDRELPQFTNLPPFEESITYDLCLISTMKHFKLSQIHFGEHTVSIKKFNTMEISLTNTYIFS